eukprot:IDg1917t1
MGCGVGAASGIGGQGTNALSAPSLRTPSTRPALRVPTPSPTPAPAPAPGRARVSCAHARRSRPLHIPAPSAAAAGAAWTRTRVLSTECAALRPTLPRQPPPPLTVRLPPPRRLWRRAYRRHRAPRAQPSPLRMRVSRRARADCCAPPLRRTRAPVRQDWRARSGNAGTDGRGALCVGKARRKFGVPRRLF